MTQQQVADLAFLEKGECYVAETGKTVHKIKITLPRSDYWQKSHPSFYGSYWESNGGEWHKTNEIREKIDESFKKIKEKYDLIEKAEEEKRNKKEMSESKEQITTEKTKIIKQPQVQTSEFIPLP